LYTLWSLIYVFVHSKILFVNLIEFGFMLAEWLPTVERYRSVKATNDKLPLSIYKHTYTELDDYIILYSACFSGLPLGFHGIGTWRCLQNRFISFICRGLYSFIFRIL